MSIHEPLHQPPNPDDLRRVPPVSSDCASVRGLLRDYADQDLASADAAVVDGHVQVCRTCAIELSRAEHETLRLRRLAPGLSEAGLPTDFASRVVERLLVDETSTFRAVESDADGDRRAAPASIGLSASRARRRLPPAVAWLASLSLVVTLAIAFALDGAHGAPEQVARLVVVESRGLADALGNPASSGIGDHQSLRVPLGGEARVDWHDVSTKVQPAANLALHGGGEVRMVDGRPLLVNGSIEVTTHRGVSIPIADGSRLDLGIGDYVVTAESMDHFAEGAASSLFASGAVPNDLFVKVEVVRGQPATVVRSSGATLVAAGQLGIYRGDAPFLPQPISVGGAAADSIRVAVPSSPATPAAVPGLTMAGSVVEPSGQAGAGTEVRLSFGSGGTTQNLSKVADQDGGFQVALDRGFDGDFTVALAFAGGSRSDLGMAAPNAYPLVRVGQTFRLVDPITLGYSVPLNGTVEDDLGMPRVGVTVVPCIVDELFGQVMALHQFRTSTGANGAYRIERLPAALPPHQSLVLVLTHPALESLVVPIPLRGSLFAVDWPTATTMQRLRTVQLHMFGAFATVHVFEEVSGLPPGTIAVHRIVQTDGGGKVPAFQVGHGRLWMRGGAVGAPVLRELVMDEVAPLPQYKPEPNQLPRPFSSLFWPLQAIPDTNVEITNTYRHQRQYRPAKDAEIQINPVLAVDDVGRGISHAQVFLVDASGPRGSLDVRFVGFSWAGGEFRLPVGGPGQDLIVIGPDGSTGFAAHPDGSMASLGLRAPGRVLVDAGVRDAAVGELTLTFTRLDAPVDGQQSVAVRFASPANGWEVGDLVPGLYQVRVGAITRTLQVLGNGVVRLN